MKTKAPMKPTSAANLARIGRMFRLIKDFMNQLYCRWRDEHEYEDIEEYGKVIAAQLPAGFTLLKMSAKPFAFTFGIGTDARYQLFVRANGIGWRRVA